jgi:hypothetical protein
MTPFFSTQLIIINSERMYKAKLGEWGVRKYSRNAPTRSNDGEDSGGPSERQSPTADTDVQDQEKEPPEIDEPLTGRHQTVDIKSLVFHVASYLDSRGQPAIIDRPQTPDLDTMMWQNLLRGLYLLERHSIFGAFATFNETCKLVEDVLRSQPQFFFRSWIMVFGTSRWGNFKDAKTSLVKFFTDMSIACLGEDCPATKAMKALRDYYADEADPELPMNCILTHLNENGLPRTHPEVLRTMRDLSVIRRRHGRIEASETYLQPMISWCQNELGNTHPETLKCRRRLAQLYMLQEGRRHEAKSLLLELIHLARSSSLTIHGPVVEDIETYVYANRDLTLLALHEGTDFEQCRTRLDEFYRVCRRYLTLQDLNSVTEQDLPETMTMEMMQTHAADLVLAYSLHCDEFGLQLRHPGDLEDSGHEQRWQDVGNFDLLVSEH